ncbi:MAG: 23S rRNA (uracil(1939)-C(5))-methyltransferase RlmD [Sphingobacteriia bacterium 24-36-13]|uniref:23S rRNA (uracil(1939)-C(5))-methyltransferase RlmD n=1 Tax=Sediminibacterium sp. TaxID=1917865 RepID=UPI000BDB5552|nr:23S rRNA (uracil(1939)-C(5))-methyltransferase RlmD [Sediminibacterium sp.]OYY09637.1 MAG: 23S rRNA (uracil(1939)-C(5))-methyltransferase RlmD [Sphingobacteriia bacterium 35-36-14]OYZ55217.1 MAG: 23S rRNA (uracil(1939)-C(5))-methyltransferase RlmD [Sphingobacteriia bacterium 24-36-13]OZA65108.1 MAG: 23S rRNA (uracil(1939)-C(5))-methyltransferase RlmD [Sphingobacteriia bacterium 39-36-14]HQS25025.1 23S rRNA (uracil(1939)-C(5))-methyltransferase RlmD [Sediminibacterium sp.]HQS35311.1 23S rRNA
MRKQRKTVVLEKVLVQDYAAEGKSLARVDGKVVFIEGAVPGDIVDVQLSKNKADWAEGHTVHIHSLSSDRVTPFCEHFGVCGGCQWQMLPYEKQLFYKQKQVTDNLTRIAKINLPEIAPIIGADFTRGYRNKMEYTFATRKYIPTDEFRRMKAEGVDFNNQPGAAGFHVRGFFDKVVEIDTCHLQEEPTNLIRKAVAAYVLANELPFYNIKSHEGWIRNLLVRSSTTGELMVNMVIAYEEKEHRIALLDQLLKSFPQITTLLYTINGKRNDSLHDQEPIVYFGKGYIIEKLEELSFKISPKSFFQTNTKQAEKLYAVTREFAELDGSQLVYDLYCGTGSIGLFVSKFAKKLIGVEMVADAIEDAKENAALNGVNHASFFAGDVIDICNDAFFEAHGKADVVITDPPRAGMHEKLVKKLLEIAAPTVVYVSCNPATQARDLALLSEKYQVTKIQPVDMFPHTLHIENVVQLKLIN